MQLLLYQQHLCQYPNIYRVKQLAVLLYNWQFKVKVKVKRSQSTENTIFPKVILNVYTD